ECEDDFTSDKSTEHMSYVKNLEYLKENSKECQQPAEYILVGDSGVHPSLSIKYEKMSEDVNSFWQSINMKKQLDIKKLQCAGNALDAITNETHLRSVVMSEIISIMKHPLEHSDDVYHNEIGSNVIIPRSKSLVTKKLVKSLFLENTKGKRCQITSETEAELNINHSPQKLKLN
ncbi:14095_t:CDS:2, partial [Entrophospora sp. SA101]